MTDHMREVNRKLAWASLLVVITIGAIIMDRLTGCSREDQDPQTIIVHEPGTPSPPVTCGDLEVGDTKTDACPEGYKGEKISVCTASGLKVAVDSCAKLPGDCETEARGKVSFENVKPIITAKCLSCHFTPKRYDDYEVAKALAPEMLRRINLAADNLERMPRLPNPELSVADKETFDKWRAGGLIKKDECPPKDPQGGAFQFLDLDYLETEVIKDLNRLETADRENARYLITSHKYDYKAPAADMAQFTRAIDKTVNSLNTTTDDLYRATAIDSRQTIYRIDLRAYGLSRGDWLGVEAADKLKIISLTSKGEIIKLLTKTRQPWFHFDNFMDVTFRNSALYYKLTRVPQTFNELTVNLGANYAVDLKNFDAILVGFNGSTIANQKNRLLSRHESRDGYLWVTYDTLELANVAARNLFEFPLLKDTGGTRLFDFAAGEVIYSLPNSLQAYALFDAKGKRQDVAPINIVRDTESPVSAEIRNASSCTRCHAGGLIAARDQIRDHVTANASQFLVKDVEIVKELYRSNNSVSATFQTDNSTYGAAAGAVGLIAGDKDPMTFATDKFLSDWTAAQVASFLLLDTEEFKVRVGQSAAARTQVGQLISGGTITYDQFVAVLPILIRDLRLFQDVIGQ